MRTSLKFLAAVAALGFTSVAHGSQGFASIGIEFGIGGSHGLTSGLAPTDSAGAVPMANWNVESGNSGTAALNADVFGVATATSASVTWTTADTWNNGGNNGFTGADNTLNNGYLDGGKGQATNVTISGLTAPGTVYDVLITSVDQHEPNKGGTISLNGTYDTVMNGNVGGPAYVQSTALQKGNYHFWANVLPVNGDLVFSTDASSNTRTPINSIELIPLPQYTPEPGSVCLLGLAGVGLLMRRRK